MPNWKEAAPRRRRRAVEFREPDWLCKEVYRELQAHDAALCIHDMVKDHPRHLTAEWSYLRFHGNRYSGAYSHQALSAWARWIEKRLGEKIDVYAYFNNDDQGHAVRNASDLRRYVLGE